MRRLASQPRNVRYGIPRRMRAQHQTQMTVHVRKLNRGMNNNQQSKQAKQQKPVPGAEFQKEFKKFQVKFKFKLNLN